MTTDEISQLTRLIAQSSKSQKQFLLAELARDLIDSSQVSTPVAIHDAAGNLLGHLLPASSAEPFPTDENSPEFYSALLRRLEEPTLTVDEFLAAIKSPD